MSQKGLEALLKPKSIAVIGASDKPGSAGHLMMRNLLAGGFSGPILPVTPGWQAVCGVLAFPDIAQLPLVPDLAVICTHSKRNIDILQQLAEKGCKACIILSASRDQFRELKACAGRWSIRILGPNSLGLLSPWQGVNASFSPVPIRCGKLAFISQSAAVSNTLLDWAQQRNLGFSWFIALGDSINIHADDLLDFLARDSKTSAILLSLEHSDDARRFVSAARSAARNKPILVIKSGRCPQARQLLGTPDSLDAAWDAAIQRAGMLRVKDTHELFSAVETLSHMRPLRGERLFIISNGAAPAALALDELADRNGTLSVLDHHTLQALRRVLPASIPVANPLNLKDDATTERYLSAISLLLESHEIDALMIIHAPSAVSSASESAEKIIRLVRQHPRGGRVTLLTNWCGEYSSRDARAAFTQAGIPTWRTPEGTVTAFMHMVGYRRNQQQLRETPAFPARLPENRLTVRQQLQQRLTAGDTRLDTHEVQAIFQGYGIQTLPTWAAADSQQAVAIAENIGYPVAVKLRAPDIPHKSGIQGVMLYLQTAADVANAADAILTRAHSAWPEARVQGLSVQSMARRAGAEELRISVQPDPLFGPVIILGEGHGEWQNAQHPVVALPPLNMTLAKILVTQAISRGAIRGRNALQALDINAVSQCLVQISNLIIDCPEIERLDIHPLLADGNNLTLLDATLILTAFSGESEARLAIRPYPQRLEENVTLKDGRQCLFRPILPEDEPGLKTFISRVTKEDLYYRYFSEINEFTHEDLANMTQIDYDREMAIVAVQPAANGEEIIGVTRAISDPDNIDAEFSILVRSDLKNIGLGRRLLEKMILYTRQHGLQQLNGITMPDNQGMIALAHKLNFRVERQPEDGIVTLQLILYSPEK
ncbi:MULTISPECIES: bifunctional acetate--CoA ligase family protein/GNAT family N-acetyltransferase [unclassified Tatumella]|uniref:bifunctional acetate--CoA ligase family protein/GNAT family N-acetyltransferase n=1 Tax=unclassified Tatumella TaxID=2649542 RepID=UPI001BAFA2D8|nr:MULTISPECIES: bifunctional acetate--CoA ligase family protein/GNAT family N-acetyltransferase [unclassified Tatumella]MBS0878306.1 bifunctional acetate--CoA ligase family protein/GNAT family N-acetyltransferase [Tatumella sp. JGM82]MBS0891795.1 bifunctional acetate--CoA ligase family protein/GNAT family N-acetyltransferase [Tatumella sp. JGM94]MBS0903072.1 bifunctional acetate--CoA ligase family protein/GNAT family N-acetyltransferase [Tatumella sp. JGM100]